jgi:hypothetical protein
MENRQAIHVRNIVAALWAGFAIPTACIWILIGDQYGWLNRHWILGAMVLATYSAPPIFLTVPEIDRAEPRRGEGGRAKALETFSFMAA